MGPKSLSVFFPAYNEEGNIRATVTKAASVLSRYRLPWEIIIIDDGSTDKTGKIASRIVKENKKIRYHRQPNGGYGHALRSGFSQARYQWVVYSDADGQFDFSELVKFVPLMEEESAIWGYRVDRQDPLFRVLTGQIWALSLKILFGLKLRDVNCGFKAVKKKVVTSLGALNSTRGAMVNAELAIKLIDQGVNIVEVPLKHYPRRFGRPTGVDWRVILVSYWELLKLRLE